MESIFSPSQFIVFLIGHEEATVSQQEQGSLIHTSSEGISGRQRGERDRGYSAFENPYPDGERVHLSVVSG